MKLSTPDKTVPLPKMAYSPATKLRYMAIGYQDAVVLSENKVMCTSGSYTGQTMLLVDWLILAGGDEMVIPWPMTSAEQIWIHAKEKAGKTLASVDDSFSSKAFVPYYSPELPQVPQVPQVTVPEEKVQAYPDRYVGEKLKWELNQETYRIAVFTNKGVLQVKSVEDGAGDCITTHTVGGTYPLIKTFFADEAAWRASLPQGGKMLIKRRGDDDWI